MRKHPAVVLLLLSFLQAICVHVGAQLLLVRLKRNMHRMKNLLQLNAPRWLDRPSCGFGFYICCKV